MKRRPRLASPRLASPQLGARAAGLPRVVAYNPDLLDRDAIVEGFVAREPLLSRLVSALRAARPEHLFVVGARGMGKTTLLRRLLFAIEDDPELASRWSPVALPEEQYNLQRLSDFWLNCAAAIAESEEQSARSLPKEVPRRPATRFAPQVRNLERSSEHEQAQREEQSAGSLPKEVPRRPATRFAAQVRNLEHEAAQSEESRGHDPRELDDAIERIHALDEPARTDRARALLREHVDTTGRGLVLFVDNARLLFDRFSKDELWTLRGALNEGDLVLVAANESVHRSLLEYGSPLYELFRIERLGPLDAHETRATLLALADRRGTPEVRRIVEEDPGRVEALRRLSGGNPRAIVLVHQVLARPDERSVSEDLLALLDQCTPYYKARVEALSDQAQAIFDAVAIHRAPITAAEVAARAKLQSKHASAQLGRLADEGVLERVPLPRKQAGYQVAERLWNVWYLMRASRRTRRSLLWLAELLREVHGGAFVRTRAQEILSKRSKDPFDADLLLAFASVLGAADPEARGLEWEALRVLASAEAPLRGRLALDAEDAHLAPVVGRMEALREMRRLLRDAPPASDGTSAFDLVAGQFLLPIQRRLGYARAIAAGEIGADALRTASPVPAGDEAELCRSLARKGLLPGPDERADYEALEAKWPGSVRWALVARTAYLLGQLEGEPRRAALGEVIAFLTGQRQEHLWASFLATAEQAGAADEIAALLARAGGAHRDPDFMLRLFFAAGGRTGWLELRLADAAARLATRPRWGHVAITACAVFGWDASHWLPYAREGLAGPDHGDFELMLTAVPLYAGVPALALDALPSLLAPMDEPDAATAMPIAILPCRAAFQTGRAGELLDTLARAPSSPAIDLVRSILRVAIEGGGAVAAVDAESRDLVARWSRLVTTPAPGRIDYEPVAEPARRRVPKRRRAR